MKNLTYFLLFTFFCAAAPQAIRFYVIRQWKYLNFTWPDEDSLKTATSKGLYVPENIVLGGVKYFEDYFYLTLPRMKHGVPATLARIKAGATHGTSPSLEPFPSWEMNGVQDCNNLQNVQNVEIDTKGQAWIIDGGWVNTLVEAVVKCSPKLVVYDIRAGRVVTVYPFPEEVASRNGTYLYDIVVDNTDGGYAYITDNSASDPGIIVYSVKENRSWKIRNNRTMAADPSATQFNVNGIPIASPINIAGIALGPKVHTSNDKVVVNEEREVYFCPVSSHHLYSINTTILRNENLSRSPHNYDSSIKDIGLKSSQTGSMIMDNQGFLYYSLLGNNAIGRWDSHTPFESTQRLIGRDDKYLEWPNSFTFDQNGNLTVLTNRLDRFVFGKIDLNEYNFWLITTFVGSKSYLYDDNFNYDLSGRTTRVYPPEPSTSTHRAEPQPQPEPHPDSHDQDYDHNQVHDHSHDHDHNQNNDHSHDHDHNMMSTTSSDVKITQSSGSSIVITISSLVLSFFLVLV